MSTKRIDEYQAAVRQTAIRQAQRAVGDKLIVVSTIKGSPVKYVRELTPNPDSPTGYYVTDSGFVNVRDAEWAIDLFLQGAAR